MLTPDKEVFLKIIRQNHPKKNESILFRAVSFCEVSNLWFEVKLSLPPRNTCEANFTTK